MNEASPAALPPPGGDTRGSRGQLVTGESGRSSLLCPNPSSANQDASQESLTQPRHVQTTEPSLVSLNKQAATNSSLPQRRGTAVELYCVRSLFTCTFQGTKCVKRSSVITQQLHLISIKALRRLHIECFGIIDGENGWEFLFKALCLKEGESQV